MQSQRSSVSLPAISNAAARPTALRRSVRWALLLLVLLVSCNDATVSENAPGEPIEVAARPACRPVRFEGDDFTVCTARHGRHELRLVLDGPDRRPLRRIERLDRVLGDELPMVAFAMNAGMFDDSGSPIGLFVNRSGRATRLNRDDGPGNFHLKPNGVFYGDTDGWHVATSAGFAKAKPKAHFATQSGPMLVIDGKLHPKFDADGASRYVRNGVGVTAGHDAVFAISESPVSFGRFARLFRNGLGCVDALYLDGAVSQLWDPATGRLDAGPPIGPIVVAIERRAPPDKPASRPR